jgi:hypothetical protein
MALAPFPRQEHSGGHGTSTTASRKSVAGLLTVVVLAIRWRCSGRLWPCRREAVQCRAALLREDDGGDFSNSSTRAALVVAFFSSSFFLFSTPSLPLGQRLWCGHEVAVGCGGKVLGHPRYPFYRRVVAMEMADGRMWPGPCGGL